MAAFDGIDVIAAQQGMIWSGVLRMQVSRYETYPVGSGQADYVGFVFAENGTAYEIGFSIPEIEDIMGQYIMCWMGIIVLSTVLMLLVFLRFFDNALVAPLENFWCGIFYQIISLPPST